MADNLISSFPRVKGRCPACGYAALFLGDGGYITCGNLQCGDPCAASDLLAHDVRAPSHQPTEEQ